MGTNNLLVKSYHTRHQMQRKKMTIQVSLLLNLDHLIIVFNLLLNMDHVVNNL